MNFVVNWSEVALEDLTRIWLASTNRDAITRAARAIDRVLAARATTCGEPRVGTERTVALAPLWILFSIDHSLRTVTVLKALELPNSSQD